MITALVTTIVAMAFVIGYLLGDHRAVRHYNSEIDRRNAELERMILEVTSRAHEPDDIRSALH